MCFSPALGRLRPEWVNLRGAAHCRVGLPKSRPWTYIQVDRQMSGRGQSRRTEPHPQTQASVPQGEALFRPPAGASPPPPHCTQRLDQARLWLLCQASTLQASGPGVHAHTMPLGSPWLGLDTHSHLSSTGR